MSLSPKQIAVAILLACGGAMGYALYSQYFLGYHPCELCMWQRYGFGAAIFFALMALVVKPSLFVKLSAFALLVNGAIAAYHFGIEQDWWDGFQTCSGVATAGSLEAMLADIEGAPVVRCDDVGWKFLGVSMAGWNVLYSGGLGVLVVLVGRKKRS